MENFFKKLEVINNHWKLIVAISAIVITIFSGVWSIYSKYDKLIEKQEAILERLNTTQQMALKSVIWNESVPLAERASVCDVYLKEGYNSLTKKRCEKIFNSTDIAVLY